MSRILLEMQDIVKEFPGVRALDHVNIQVAEKSIHALVGENGAGKSTLMKVLSGVYPYGTYEGSILYDGIECKFNNIRESETKGIVIIHQELALIPYLSIMENIFLGNEQAVRGVINWDKCRCEAMRLMEVVGLNERPETPVNKIGVGKQQLVEIAKALSKNVRLLILDEPTAALNDEDSAKLLDLILRLRKEREMTGIIISHKLNEVTKVADKITVIRDGATIETIDCHMQQITEERIIKGMVGREITNRYPRRENKAGEVRFEVKDWVVHSPEYRERLIVDHVSFQVRRGEVVGIAGLMGAGRTELAMSIFGRSYGAGISGRVFKDGKEIQVRSVSDAIENGIAYVTEDRKSQGLILIDSIRANITLPSLKALSRLGIVNENEEVKVCEEYFNKLVIKATDIHQLTGNLSGGNQQKVMLARWIYADPDVLILDEPTRGIDVGAKYEIYCIINELAESGKSVIVISSELPEVLGISDRVYVMNEGRFVGEVSGEEATSENIMHCIMQSNC
ncbi:putative multiple sugar transport system ATP-binding protein [Anaerobacterium chartisolvens]|uniref:Putative multiple sugar transport system ATP-binding protein n=1 Tax=Anaerobacterium chartisolvens TaxID=1297424 RepID=A0A369B5V1_9FIRM|nr:multiple monosaccharide ABC transporter ATP-binding protein [Anaerobacterium chartisolvens]RCX16873.1 putative multiple sugar transport system ATP-binding protein [Anaerobacterium chartisolvens]